MTCGVYAIINIIDGSRYVGSSNNLEYRAEQHFHRLELRTHHNYKLQKAYDLSPDGFAFVILETPWLEEIRLREQIWINRLGKYKPLYNIRLEVEMTNE